MFNSYTEDFRKNAVAVVRAGVAINNLAKRLNIPPTSIRNWVDNPKYSEIGPADKSLIESLPTEEKGQTGLVRIGQNEIFQNPNNLPAIKIKVGQVEIETPENISAASFKLLILSLREIHVL